MKESVKIDTLIISRIRKESKKRGQTMGGFLELAAKQSLVPQYSIMDNCDAFREFLDSKKIKWRGEGHITVLVDVADPFGIGMEWGMFKYQNSPLFKTK